ncbi:MAG: polysaccharide deacetylase family protein [Alphaproteobacteria bacterium]|nr:polysaccharide deacetylase family protein [Alphaproteobacteria bacterium]
MIYNIWRLARLFAAAASAAALAPCVLGALGAGAANAADSAVILIYHRFGDARYPVTNVRLEQFEAHIAALTAGKYAVLPLPEIVAALAGGKPLPDRAVAITVDDAYRSVYAEAWPRLRAAGLPFTLFVATEPVEAGLPDYMTWDQIRELRDGGVTIGAHSHSHLHMVDATAKQNREEIEISNRILRRELGAKPALFAYPFGEAGNAVMALAKKSGYRAAFGQHSGVIAPGQPLFYLPRFPVNEAHAAPERMRLALDALPLPVRDVAPADPLIAAGANPPVFRFTLGEAAGDAGRLACYHSERGKMALQRAGERRIEIRFDAPFPKGRSRINCTLPGPDGRWQWYGTQFYVKP